VVLLQIGANLALLFVFLVRFFKIDVFWLDQRVSFLLLFALIFILAQIGFANAHGHLRVHLRVIFHKYFVVMLPIIFLFQFYLAPSLSVELVERSG
jgi:hypothetical protein